MVVAQVVHVRNLTSRTFTIKAGDAVYSSVKVASADAPCSGGVLTVPPQFSEDTEGLVVPWETVTRSGLEISVEGAEQVLRCVVGPRPGRGDSLMSAQCCSSRSRPPTNEGENDSTRDWLQYRDDDWEPLAEERWISLGRRHYLGAVGGAVDMYLTFRELPRPVAQLVDLVYFEPAALCVPPNTVLLNVFDLVSAAAIPNAMLNNTMFNSFGAFHTAVEVYREEWAYYRTPSESTTGVVRSPFPRQHPVHVYRQSVVMGTTPLKDWEVRYLIQKKLAPKWMGHKYQLLRRNCIHFCDDFLLSLGVKGVPSWVRGLHEAGASVFQVPWPFSLFTGQPQQPQLMDDTDHTSYNAVIQAGGQPPRAEAEAEASPAPGKARPSSSRGGASQGSTAARSPDQNTAAPLSARSDRSGYTEWDSDEGERRAQTRAAQPAAAEAL